MIQSWRGGRTSDNEIETGNDKNQISNHFILANGRQFSIAWIDE